jgi:capsular polysaccharide biosynthesis protein
VELKKLLIIYKNNIKQLILFIILGLTLGTISFYVPKSYYTTGSLYVTSKVDPDNTSYFNYDGYYAQQTALNYTNTVLATLESKPIIATALYKIDINVNDQVLKKYKRNIIVIKESPQVIKFTVKGKTPEESKKLWNNLVDFTVEDLNRINIQNGDNNLSINKIGNTIFTSQYYYPIYMHIILGILIFTFLDLVYLTSREYLKEDLKK